jgi:hypothetical protein
MLKNNVEHFMGKRKLLAFEGQSIEEFIIDEKRKAAELIRADRQGINFGR